MAKEDQTTVNQSEEYKYLNRVDEVGSLPGSNREQDVLEAVLLGTIDADIRSDMSRSLGEVRIDSATQLDVSAATVPVSPEDTTGEAIDPASETTLSALAAALASNGADTLQVDQQGAVDVSSRDGRNLGDVDVTDLPDSDYAEADGAALDAGTTNTYTLSAAGADSLDGRVRASGTYDVSVEWQLSTGTVARSNTVATGVTGGTWTDLSGLTAVTPYAAVKVTDTSGAAQTTTVAAHLR